MTPAGLGRAITGRDGQERWRPTSRRRRLSPASVLALSSSAVAVTAAAAIATAAALIARKVVSPLAGDPAEDVRILEVINDLDGSPTAITLAADPNTLAAGRYGLWFEGTRGHLRLGEVIHHDLWANTVTREVLGVDAGQPSAGMGRWNQYYYAGTPSAALDLRYEDVLVDSPTGPLPVWFVAASSAVPARQTWAVLVHGRGATREETLRALPVLHRLGFPALVMAYRNDAEALGVPRGRYHFGAAEWEDVEAAIVYAVEQGAHEVVLIGWSMGGAIAMQLLDRSWTSSFVRAVVLDAPVLDWRNVLEHQARVHRVPAALSRISQRVLSGSQTHRLAALTQPVDWNALDWVARANEINLPILIVHSDTDEFVPSTPSRALARARPDVVELVSSIDSGHTREWNADPAAWESAVARFLLSL